MVSPCGDRFKNIREADTIIILSSFFTILYHLEKAIKKSKTSLWLFGFTREFLFLLRQ